MHKIIVLHEIGAPDHYQGLTTLALEKGITLERREFRFLKQFVLGILKADKALILRSISNGFWLLRQLMGATRNQCIVLGIAPFDWRMACLLPIFSYNRTYWHTSWPYWPGLAGKHYPYPIRNRIVKWAWRYFLNEQLRGAFFVTQYAMNNFKIGLNIQVPTWVVHHSFNPSYFYFENNAAKEFFTVGFVGRLEWTKGVAKVLELSEVLGDARYRFVIAGKGSMREDVKSAEVKSNGRLSYKGYLNPKLLGELYRNMDFLLVPSIRTGDWEEAFGMVIVEAMACGVVPITTNHPGPLEILTGDLADNIFSEEQFIDGTIGVLLRAHHDPAYLGKLRVCARETSKGYTTSTISKLWSGVL